MSEAEQGPTEEQIRAFEEQLKHIRVEDVIVQTLVTLVNLGARRLGPDRARPTAATWARRSSPSRARGR